MESIKELITKLSLLPSVSGSERLAANEMTELISPYFDGYEQDAAGNFIFRRMCGRENAVKILVDAHYDEVGFVISSIGEDGFCRVATVGGVDTRILQASEVVIYGKEPVYAVIASTPPHLQDKGDSEKLPEISDLLLDTGYSTQELKKLIRVGSPVGFFPLVTGLANDRICGKGFDDKSCAAAAVYGIASTEREKQAGDVYLMLSTREEIGGAGTRVGGFFVNPDYAIVVDVDFARAPGTEKRDTTVMGEGVSVEYTPILDRDITAAALSACEKHGIKHNLVANGAGSGTNADELCILREGIPCTVIGIPIASMHTASEVLDPADALATASLISQLICDKGLADKLANTEAK